MLVFILNILISLGSIITALFALSIIFNYDLPMFFIITQKYFPVYLRLIAKYNVKYPCVMDYVSKSDTHFKDIKGIDDRQAFIFIKDSSFVIINRHDTNIYVEIPFESILYRSCHISGTYGEFYKFVISLTYKCYGKEERFSFATPYYHHKIDPLIHRMYPNLLNDEKLYDFICENFPNEDEYEHQRKLERNKRSSIIFETSIFHNFTNDAE